MLSNKIQAWLQEGGSYIDGLSLHALLGAGTSHQSLRSYLNFPLIPPAAWELLRKEFRAYIATHPPAISAQRPPSPKPTADRPPQVPAVLRPLYAQGKALLKERDGHRAQLVQQAQHPDKFTNKDRHLTAKVIMEVQAEIDDVYQRIRRYQDEGQLPEAGSTKRIIAETVQKINRMGSLRSAISRLNKRLKAPETSQQKQEMETELLAKKVELSDLADQLGLDK